jgi:hypothetical protein
MHRSGIALAASMLVSACHGADAVDDGLGPGDTGSLTHASDTVASTSVGSSESTGAGATTAMTTVADTSSSSGAAEGPIFDLGSEPDVAPPAEGCNAVDFLFVVDDSSSMSTHQQNLIDNFPTFIDGIESTLGAVDSFQVGVIATDAFSGNPGACILLGALITETTGAGPESSDAVCGPYASGYAYMTEDDDLEETFACAAQVGTIGNGFERPMEAMVTTVGKTLGDVGGCNEGFLRDDALLVVVVITDEYDGEGDPEDLGGSEDPPTSTGDPQSWYDAVVAAKGGIAENAAALAITNYEGGACPPDDLGHDGVNIVSWVELFGDNGIVGGICEADYGPFFEQATDVVAEACAGFVPAG